MNKRLKYKLLDNILWVSSMFKPKALYCENNIENYETHNENFFISDSWLKKYVFIAVLNKKNINMDVFKHVFLEPWKIL